VNPGRNDPCPCGSGKKFKKCCAIKLESNLTAPTPAECNQLAALFNAGRYIELESQSRLLIKRYPESVLAWNALRASLQAQSKDALPAFQKAAELLPDDASAHYNLGVALQEHGRLDGAIASYRRALEIEPDYVMAYNNLGNTLKDLGRLDDAVASYRRALEIKPDLAMTHSNMGNALQDLGRLDEAVASYRRALEIKPDFVEAHYNLGNALQDLGRLDDAVASYRRALEIEPTFAGAHCNLGVTLRDLGRPDDAVMSYRRALEIKPDFAEAHCNLGNTLQDLGRLDEAVASYRHALEIKPNFVEAHNSLLFVHNYLPDQSAAILLLEAKNFGDLVRRQAKPYTGWRSIPEADRCLRVGFVSGDLRNHPVGYFIEGLLAELASNASDRLELFAYYNHFRTDALTERVKTCCHGWRSAMGLSDEILARLIHDDAIDILIDLSGHTRYNRLPMFAWKPAPVQASWLGYFATTGVAEIDYILGDKWLLPDGEKHHFVEKGWHLTGPGCLTPPKEEIKVEYLLPALRNSSITFGSLNNLTKMNDRVVACWARILNIIPNSRLYLNTSSLRSDSIKKSVIDRYAGHGIAENRLILEATNGRANALNSYNRIDIALDPFPYPGGTTSFEALWMGVPVLTMRGSNYISHLGESILHNAALPDWIASDEDDYVTKALAFTSDFGHLAALRAGLRQQVLASPLFDVPCFARHFEAALRGMWVQWCINNKKIVSG
jgi:predicted O-linked N-acetylglucosamine transferase (SPINDLY family)